MIQYFTEDIKFSLKHKRIVSRWLKEIASANKRSIGALNYIFCSDSYLLDINRQFLGHDYFTDIITFDNSDDYAGQYKDGALSGDIYISIDTVKVNAEQYGEGFERELSRVIAHGLLHLIGFDDTDEALQQEMTFQENTALLLLEKIRSDNN